MSVQLSLLPDVPALGAQDIAAPQGLEYHPQLLTARDEAELLAQIDNDDSAWLTDLSRRVQHFGYKYDYSNRRLDGEAHIGPLPSWLIELAHQVRAAASEESKRLLDPHRPFEQAIINEYLPGQGIAPHTDRDCFGPVVATVSLGSAVDMDFFRDATGDKYVERLEPCSLVLMRGDARATWRHGIAKRQTDTRNRHKYPRQRRVSVTFRTIAGSTPAELA